LLEAANEQHGAVGRALLVGREGDAVSGRRAREAPRHVRSSLRSGVPCQVRLARITMPRRHEIYTTSAFRRQRPLSRGSPENVLQRSAGAVARAESPSPRDLWQPRGGPVTVRAGGVPTSRRVAFPRRYG